MSDEPDHLVLRYLRRMDEKLDNLNNKVGELVVRISAVERELAGSKSPDTDFAGMQARMDGFDRRLDRIENRLELVPV